FLPSTPTGLRQLGILKTPDNLDGFQRCYGVVHDNYIKFDQKLTSPSEGAQLIKSIISSGVSLTSIYSPEDISEL
ncbi:hypothetical protein, partial [Escherichia coli]|uniref:hypothetical protein n=1 Tax=Escherichia coli TaxID=562 RepID=UPI003851286D